MNSKPKNIVADFYQTDIVNNKTIMNDFFHPEISLTWNSSDGLTTMNYEDLNAFFNEIRRTYSDLTIEVSHLIPSEEYVTVCYDAKRILDDSEEEVAIAHFMTLWEVKDGKLYRGYQISQPGIKA